LSETIATFSPQSALTSVDLPTFGLPATATNPLRTASGVEIERVRQQLRRRRRPELARRREIDDPVDPELGEALPAAAAGRGRHREHLDVAGTVALGDRGRQRRLLRADAERIRGVLDVDAFEHPSVPHADHGADVEVGVRRVRALRDLDGALVEL